MEAGDSRADEAPAAAGAADLFDVVVLGAGAGGAVVALEAKALGLKAAYVFEPPPGAEGEAEAEAGPKGAGVRAGVRVGAGAGVGVGADCCALALMRRAAALAFDLRDARLYGWAGGGGAGGASSGCGNGGGGERDADALDDGRHRHDWSTLADAARSFAVAAAQRRRSQLHAAGVTVLDGRAQRMGGGALRVRGDAGVEGERWLRAGALVVAAPPAEGGAGLVTRGAAALLARGRAPGRTLVLGADTRAVEAAAALAALGAQVTVLTNESEILPGLDRQLAQLLRRHMEEKLSVTCLLGYQVESVSGAAGERGGRVAVSAARGDGGVRADAHYDTVFRSDASCPRESSAAWLSLAEAAGAPVFEVGPSAVEGAALARLLLGPLVPPPEDSSSPAAADLVIGAVRAPAIEYGYVGLSEEKAVERLGADGVQVYHSHFAPLEWGLPAREPTGGRCYVKLVCARAREPSQERVLGLHALAPRAAEIAQGFSLALRLGASRVDFMALAGLQATSGGRLGALGAGRRGGGGGGCAVAERQATC